ncbi:MAG: GDSL family lipase [Armatimonadetes bacterium]|nr:GDSL family lipase [Armatimonadota bacterium]
MSHESEETSSEETSSEAPADGTQDPVVPRAAEWPGEPGVWEGVARTQAEEARLAGARLVFLGDSITQGWTAEGREPWQSRFAPLGAVNMGIGGDRTQNLLWRIQRLGVLDGLAPALVVLKIGVNNLWQDVHAYGPARVAEGVQRVIAAIREKCPQARVLALGILPTQADPAHPMRAALRAINARSAASLPTPDGRIRFADLGEHFLEADGTISEETMPDGCHLAKASSRACLVRTSKNDASNVLRTIRQQYQMCGRTIFSVS